MKLWKKPLEKKNKILFQRLFLTSLNSWVQMEKGVSATD
jgi:hypothetical protein